jgi:competence protein ComEC
MIPNHKGEIPVVILLVPFLLGIVLGLNLLQGANINWLLAAFAVFSFVFILLNLNYSRYKLYKTRWLGGTLIFVILFLFGWINVIRYSELNKNNHFSKIKSQYLLVKINNEPASKNGFLRFTANVEATVNNGQKSAASGTLLITIKDTSARNLFYGDELLIPAKYSPVDPPFNPAEFNYKKYLADKNIFYQAFLYPKQFVVLNSNAGNPLIANSLRLRRQLVEKLKSNITDTGAFAVASTLILGYKADLSENILQAYSKTGTVYVLSVSGSQVAIIYLLLTFALGFLGRYRHGKLIKAVIIIAILWYYAMLTGFSLAVCRVSVMVSLVIIGKTFSRYINTLNLLGVSAFLLLLYDPLFITEVGFQLSFIAVTGLILFQPVVYKWIKFKNKWADKLWALCSVSIAAQVVIFPISALYFHQFPVYFLISNLFVTIPAALVMYLGIFYLLLPRVPVLSKSIAFILEKTIQLMNKGLSVIADAPYTTVNKIWLNTYEYILLYAIIISLFYFLYNKKIGLLKVSLFGILLLSVSISIKKIHFQQSNEIAWLSLKKHKGIIFRSGNSAVILTDVKNSDKTYQYSVQPYLDSCEINQAIIYNLNQDINGPFLIRKYGLIEFLNNNIFISDGHVKNNIIAPKLKIDYIYFTGYPDTGLNNINAAFDYRMLIVDGSNSETLIAEIEKNSKSTPFNYKILKRNNSLITVSN